MADTDDSLMREVQEDLRREKFARLWDQYGLAALAIAVALIMGVLGYQWWRGAQLKEAQTYGAKYQAALRLSVEGKTAEANKAFAEIAANGPKGYVILSRLKLAAASAKAGKTDDAVGLYDAVVNDGGADQLLAGFARLQAAALRADKADWTEMQNRLIDLVKADSPWRYSAEELLGLAAQKAGKLGESRKYFEQLVANPVVPQSISARARVLLSLVATEELKRAAPKKDSNKDKRLTPKKSDKEPAAAGAEVNN